MLRLLRSACELSKVVTLGPGPSQSRTATILGRTLTLRQWGIEYELDQQHVSRALKALGLTGWGLLEPTMWVDQKPVKSARCAKQQNGNPPEEVSEEDDLLIGERMNLFQSVAARFNFLAVDRPLCDRVDGPPLTSSSASHSSNNPSSASTARTSSFGNVRRVCGGFEVPATHRPDCNCWDIALVIVWRREDERQQTECLCDTAGICQPFCQRNHLAGNIWAKQAPVGHGLKRVWKPVHEIYHW